MKGKKLFSIVILIILVGTGLYFANGTALQGAFGRHGSPLNTASSTTDDFSNSGPTGTFVGGTYTTSLSTVSTGGVSKSAFIRATAEDAFAATKFNYTFDSAQNLSGYKSLTYFIRSSDTTHAITLTLDGTGTDLTCNTGTLTNTWTKEICSFSGTTADLTAVSTLSWSISTGSITKGAVYDVDEISLDK